MAVPGPPPTSIATLLLVGWLVTDPLGAVRITSGGPQTVHVAEGRDILISCLFELETSDAGELDIEWSIINPDTTKLDPIILTYVHKQVFDYPSAFSNRFGFTELDPSRGNASVWVRALRMSDTSTFQCKVKKAPGIDTRKVTVGVHAQPQVPKCWADRSDQDVVLHCHSEAGSPPLTYTWERISGSSRSLPWSSTTDSGSGTLLIRNSTDTSLGTYRCRVRNLVGQEECELVLSTPAGRSETGVIVGAVLGALLALLLLLLLLLLLCCCCRKRHREKDQPHDIREDVAPPLSHAPSVRSIRSYKAHQARKPGRVTFYNALPTIETTRSLTSDQPTLPRHSPVMLNEGSRLDFVV